MTTTPQTRRSTSAPLARAALSGHLDTRTAATEVAQDLNEALAGQECDLAFIFASYHHNAGLAAGAEIIRSAISPKVMLGVTAESVLGNDQELEGVAGLSVVALSIPNANLHAFHIGPGAPTVKWDDPQSVRQLIGYNEDLRATILLADPFTTPISKVLPAIAECGQAEESAAGPGRAGRAVPVVGGMSSGASQPGHNVLIYNDRPVTAGAVGVSISGGVGIDVVVSQGCRPVGDALVITKVNGNVILELGGKKALDALKEMAEAMAPRDRESLGKGVLAGLVINEYKDRFGRGDFLVRNILGFDQKTGGIAVGDMPRVGQTTQFHVRDATTAEEDLQLLLDAQQLKDQPFAGLLFTCNGRGTKMFADRNHDVSVVRNRLGELPLAGFFAAGEIGPIGLHSYLHGHTAALALFRGK